MRAACLRVTQSRRFAREDTARATSGSSLMCRRARRACSRSMPLAPACQRLCPNVVPVAVVPLEPCRRPPMAGSTARALPEPNRIFTRSAARRSPPNTRRGSDLAALFRRVLASTSRPRRQFLRSRAATPCSRSVVSACGHLRWISPAAAVLTARGRGFAGMLAEPPRAEPAAADRADGRSASGCPSQQQRLWFLRSAGSPEKQPTTCRLRCGCWANSISRLHRRARRSRRPPRAPPVLHGDTFGTSLARRISGPAAPDRGLVKTLQRGRRCAMARLQRPVDLVARASAARRLFRPGRQPGRFCRWLVHHTSVRRLVLGGAHARLPALWLCRTGPRTRPPSRRCRAICGLRAWQRWLRATVLDRQLAYWREARGLRRAVGAAHRPAACRGLASSRAALRFAFSRSRRGLRRWRVRQGATLFMTFWPPSTAAQRCGGAGRYRGRHPDRRRGGAELDGSIGFFVNTLALRRRRYRRCFAPLLAQVARTRLARLRPSGPAVRGARRGSPSRPRHRLTADLPGDVHAGKQRARALVEGLKSRNLLHIGVTPAKFDLRSAHRDATPGLSAIRIRAALFDAATVARIGELLSLCSTACWPRRTAPCRAPILIGPRAR